MKPPHLFPLQEAFERLRLASRDIRLAELALGDDPPLAGEALYHAQHDEPRQLLFGTRVKCGAVDFATAPDAFTRLARIGEVERRLADAHFADDTRSDWPRSRAALTSTPAPASQTIPAVSPRDLSASRVSRRPARRCPRYPREPTVYRPQTL